MLHRLTSEYEATVTSTFAQINLPFGRFTSHIRRTLDCNFCPGWDYLRKSPPSVAGMEIRNE